jgi:hypothetical protein
VPESGDALATVSPKRQRFWWSSRPSASSGRRRGIRLIQAAFILCVAVGFVIINSDNFSLLTRLVQREIASVTTQNFDLRGKIETPDPDGAAPSLPKGAAVAIPANELSLPENGVAPSTSFPGQGTEAPATHVPSLPSADAVSPPPESEPVAAPSVTMPEPAKPPEPDSPAAGATSTPTAGSGSQLPASETAALVARGDALVSERDLASARLFYERAAEMGDGQGALRMGMTFDPAFLQRAAIRGGQGDQQKALSWYRRARDLGDAEADRLLKSLAPH